MLWTQESLYRAVTCKILQTVRGSCQAVSRAALWLVHPSCASLLPGPGNSAMPGLPFPIPRTLPYLPLAQQHLLHLSQVCSLANAFTMLEDFGQLQFGELADWGHDGLMGSQLSPHKILFGVSLHNSVTL